VFRTEFESPQRILLRIAIPIIPSKHSHTQPNKKKLIFVETSLEFLIAVKEWLHNRGHRGGDLVERGSLDVRLADDLAHAGVGEDRSVWEAPTVDVLTASEAIGSIEDVQLSAWRAVGLAHHPRHQALEPPLVGVDAQGHVVYGGGQDDDQQAAPTHLLRLHVHLISNSPVVVFIRLALPFYGSCHGSFGN